MEWLIAILLGFIVGKYFSLIFLIVVSGVSVIASLAMIFSRENQGLGSLIVMGMVSLTALMNAVMWATYYITTHQTWIGHFLHKFILR